jgi:AraC family transcriptional regulator of adaptative response / DNA-3-methyladenine glycosylase II
VRKELGVSPVELAQTNRLLLAKRLIAETRLPLTQVAFAAGFESVRRFNALFRSHYRLTPSALRRSTTQAFAADCLRLVLAYRPPLDWKALLRFLAARAIPGVECVTNDSYSRTVGIGERRGWLSVSPIADRHLLAVDLSTALAPSLPAILSRLRNLFDLEARPDIIAGHLARDPLLAKGVAKRPGLRVPGAFDSFELAMRAILGQQVTVRGATTLASRFAERFGEAIDTPLPGLNRITPAIHALAATRLTTLTALGLPAARAESLRNLARVVSRGDIDLEPGVDPTMIVSRLVEQPGIGPWTAEYIAMRGLRWPDAFPAGDLGLMKATEMKSAKELGRMAERWRPWRAYAAMHLWESLKSDSNVNNGRTQ